MADPRPPGPSSRNPAVPKSSAHAPAGPVANPALVAELLPSSWLDLPAEGSDFQSLASQVVELAKTLTGASGSAIAFRGEQGTVCRARSGGVAPPVGASVDTTSGISKQCLDSGTSLCCADIASDTRVDPEMSHAAGIRAVAVVPIYSGGEISGILEVFSSIPGMFNDQHLKMLEQLASLVGAAANKPSAEPSSVSNADVPRVAERDIRLMVELEPAYRTFFRNLADVVLLRSVSAPASPSSQAQGWNNVFVESYVPWTRFLESVLLHILVVGMFAGLSRIWPRELLEFPRLPVEAHITYYPSAQSFQMSETSRAAAHARNESRGARRESARSGREELAASVIRVPDNKKEEALPAPPLARPALAVSRVQIPGLGTAASVLPSPPAVEGAKARLPVLPGFSAVAPSPDFGRGSGSRRVSAPGVAGIPPSPDVGGSMARVLISAGRVGHSGPAGDNSIVPPPPTINDHPLLTYGGAGGSKTGAEVVAPPPSLEGGGSAFGAGRAGALAGGGTQVVPPPPSFEGTGNSGGRGRGGSLAGPGSAVVPPPPSVAGGGNYGGKRIGSLGGGGSEVVPPPPSVSGGGNGRGERIGSLGGGGSEVVPPPPSVPGGGGGGTSLGGGRAGSLARAGTERALPPGSAPSGGTPEGGGGAGAKDIPVPSVRSVGGSRMPAIFQDVELRVVGLAMALPRTSYFSNYEVYIAEKFVSKQESQLIKLVYVFLPYQRPLSEYGFDTLKVRKVRVTRDPICDESLMQMSWPEGKGGSSTSNSGGAAVANAADRKDLLPCYRTTAEDYRRAVSRGR